MKDLPKDLEQILKETKEKIDKFGWTVIASELEDNFPLAYTVGLWKNFNHPEIALTGLPHKVANEVLNTVAELVSKGSTFAAGDRSTEVLHDYPVAFASIGQAPLGAAKSIEPDFTAIQLIWPDIDGKFPWEEGSKGAPQVLLSESVN